MRSKATDTFIYSLLSILFYLFTGNDILEKREKREVKREKNEKGTTIFFRKLSFLFGDPWENRTPDFAVRGRRLSRLTKGPYFGEKAVFSPNKEKSRHLPIFPGRLQPSIFGTTKLNFCVRNGNRWNLGVIGTGYECAWSNCLKPSLYIFSFSFWRSYLQNWTTTALSWANAEPSRRLWSSPRPISTR